MILVLVAVLPLVLAFLLLMVFQLNSYKVGLITLGVTMLLVSVVPPFHLFPFDIALSLGKGVAGSLSLLSVLLPAALLYQFQRIGGSTAIFARIITRITADRDLLVLLLVFGLAPLLNSICGQNVPVFVISPVLLTLRIPPLRVACLTLIWMVTSAWGTMSVVTVLVSSLTGVPSIVIGSDSAILLMPATLGLCAFALLLSGRSIKEMLHAWVAITGTAIILTGGAWLSVRLIGVELVGILTSLAAIAFLMLVGRVQDHRSTSQHAWHRSRPGTMSLDRSLLWRSLLPFIILTALLSVTRMIDPLSIWLQTHAILVVSQLGLQLPVLYLPGSWLLVTACLVIPLLRLTESQVWQATTCACKQFAPSALAIISFLAVAQTMQASGMVASFSMAAATLGAQYVWISPWLGAISGWATGSAISGNSLFASLQKSAALRAGLSVPWIIAAQSTASTIGRILSPTSTIISASAADIAGQEGLILRQATLPVLWSIAVLMALLSVIISYSPATLAIAILVTILPILFVVSRRRSWQAFVAGGMVMQAATSLTFQLDLERLAHLPMGQRSRALLEQLAQASEAMSLYQLSMAIAQPTTIVHRLLHSLQEQGYVQREAQGRHYVLGPALTAEEQEPSTLSPPTILHAQQAIVQVTCLPQVQGDPVPWVCLLPHIEALSTHMREVVYLAVLQGEQVVPVAVAKPKRLLYLAIEIGSPIPLHRSGCGKVLLEYQRKDLHTTLVRGATSTYSAERVITNMQHSSVETQYGQRDAYAIDDEELEDGVRSFAVPVRDEHGVLIAALGLSGPLTRLPLERLDTIVGELRRTSINMTHALLNSGTAPQVSISNRSVLENRQQNRLYSA